MTQEDKEDFENKNICRFCGKKIEFDKVRDHCHLTGAYRRLAHSKCNDNVKQSERNFFLFHLTTLVTTIVINFFLKKMVDKKIDRVNFDNIPKTDEEHISATHGGIRFIESYRFSSSSLGI